MKREAAFYQRAQSGRIQLQALRTDAEALQAAVYIEQVLSLAKSFQIEGVPQVDVPQDPSGITRETIMHPLYRVEQFMARIYAKNIFEIDSNLSQNFVYLDSNWRQQVNSLIANIRDHIQRTDSLKPKLKEKILAKLSELQQEVDRERTRVESATEALIVLTEGIAEGAKNLEPAARLLERIIGSFSKLRVEIDIRQKKLPPPSDIGLPKPEENKNGS